MCQVMLILWSSVWKKSMYRSPVFLLMCSFWYISSEQGWQRRHLTTSRMISCLASSSDWMALFSLLRTKTRSCSFSNRRRTFFILSQPTPWPSRTLCTTSFKNCWFSLDRTQFQSSSGDVRNYTVLDEDHIWNLNKCNDNVTFVIFEMIHYLVLLTRPWGEGDSLFTVGLCLITEDFWSTSARGARAPEKKNQNNDVPEHDWAG